MQCPQCHAENPAEARFCMQCAAELARLCPQCGRSLPAEARFCMACGGKVTQPDARAPGAVPPRLEDMQERLYIPEPLRQRMDAAAREMVGENRLVTALFADISGFTALSQRLATEAVVKKREYGSPKAILATISLACQAGFPAMLEKAIMTTPSPK